MEFRDLGGLGAVFLLKIINIFVNFIFFFILYCVYKKIFNIFVNFIFFFILYGVYEIYYKFLIHLSGIAIFFNFPVKNLIVVN